MAFKIVLLLLIIPLVMVWIADFLEYVFHNPKKE